MIQANRQAKAQAAQDAVANQLLQQHGWAPPPRAGLVAPGVNPQTGQPNVLRLKHEQGSLRSGP
jgi:hypothetical protein